MSLPMNMDPYSSITKFGASPQSVSGLQLNIGPNPNGRTLLNSTVILSNVAITTDVVPVKHPELKTSLKGLMSYGAVVFCRIFTGNEKPGNTKGVWIHAAQLNTIFENQRPQIDLLLKRRKEFKEAPIAMLNYLPKQPTISLNRVYQPPKSFDITTNGLKNLKPNVFSEFDKEYTPELMLTPIDVLNHWGFGGVLQQIRNDEGLAQATINVGGNTLMANYWKKLNPSFKGMDVGFIIEYKTTTKGINQGTRLNIREWCGCGIPEPHELRSKDFNGYAASSIYLQVGYVTDWQNFYVKPNVHMLSEDEDLSQDQLNGNGSYVVVNINYAVFSV